MLTDRREQLLRFIVEEHVRTAQPVASGAVVSRHGLPVSPATIRNEMARLEEEGYIVQPHTSAGRVPSDRGYRYYVEALMQPRDLPVAVQETIRHQFHQAAGEVEEWAHLAAAVLAARLSYAAVVTAPQATQPRLRRLHLVSVHDTMALLLIVLQEARVVEHALTLERACGEEKLSAVAARLNSLYAGHSADEIRDLQVEHPPLEADALRVALDLLDSVEDAWFGESYLEGLPDMLREPEFAEGERILELLDLLEQPNLPKAIPLPRAGQRKLTVIIGSEHPNDAMRQCSVVISRYGGASGLRGTISVVGPTRMQYRKAVSMVRYMDSIMEELLEAYLS